MSAHLELPNVRIPGVAGGAPVRLPPFTGVAQPRYAPPAIDLDVEWHVGPSDFTPAFVWLQHFRAGFEVDGTVDECTNRLQICASYRDHVALVYGVVSLELALDGPVVEGPLGAFSAHAGLVQDPRVIGTRGLTRAEIDAVVRWAAPCNTTPDLANLRG